MDTTTFFLIIIILVAIILIAVGIYMILVLHEARITLRRFNNILNHVDSIIEVMDDKIVRPVGSLFGVAGILKEVLVIFRDFTSKRKGPKNGEHEQ